MAGPDKAPESPTSRNTKLLSLAGWKCACQFMGGREGGLFGLKDAVILLHYFLLSHTPLIQTQNTN